MKVQARITLPADMRRGIDALRAEWNPERSAGNPAHVTITYQDEAPDPALLAERLRLAAAVTCPFSLVVGLARRFPEPVRGVYLAVTDPLGVVAAIRERVLTPPFTRRERFGLHITLLHPDQGVRLESAWPTLAELPPVGRFDVTELQMVGPDNAVLAVFPLVGD